MEVTPGDVDAFVQALAADATAADRITSVRCAAVSFRIKHNTGCSFDWHPKAGAGGLGVIGNVDWLGLSW